MGAVLPVVAAMATRPARQVAGEQEDHDDGDDLDHGVCSLKVEVAVSSFVTFGSRYEVGHGP